VLPPLRHRYDVIDARRSDRQCSRLFRASVLASSQRSRGKDRKMTTPAAPVAPGKHPNHYDLTGGGISVIYDTTTFGGKPMLSYHDQTVSRNFVGDQIRTADTEIGTLVTVTISLTPDSGSTTFTLLIPEVNLRASDSASISTYGITTAASFDDHRAAAAGPDRTLHDP